VAAVVFAGFARITDWNDPDQAPLIAGAVAGSILGGLGLFVLNFVVSALLQGIVVNAAARSTLGERPTVRSTWPAMKPHLWRLVGWTALLGAAVLVIFLLLIGVILLGVALGPIGIAVSIAVSLLLGLGAVVLWFWLYTKLSIVPSVIVLERTSIRAAVRRSWRLTNGYFWRTLGAEILVSLIISVAIQIITTPISLLGSVGTLLDPNNTGAAISVAVIVQIIVVAIGVLGGAISAFVTSALVALIYIDLRMRKEGLDLVLQRHVEGGAPEADPFAPGPR
jgi:membrane-anchored glycerophosphoryl diester phosphodiesterase (GDPDase)